MSLQQCTNMQHNPANSGITIAQQDQSSVRTCSTILRTPASPELNKIRGNRKLCYHRLTKHSGSMSLQQCTNMQHNPANSGITRTQQDQSTILRTPASPELNKIRGNRKLCYHRLTKHSGSMSLQQCTNMQHNPANSGITIAQQDQRLTKHSGSMSLQQCTNMQHNPANSRHHHSSGPAHHDRTITLSPILTAFY
ncbi:hypothetical protein J6590_021542 [Homalodisca vitripennis]|nr:hypothetical protein J6590_021542 [Homalodisca vitripennis]